MSSTYPVAPERLVATLSALFREQGDTEMAELLAAATSRIEATDYDNWGEGTDIYTLFLEVPLERYAGVEPRLPDVEKAIAAKAGKVARPPRAWLQHVEITPVLVPALTPPEPQPAEGDHLWTPGALRLFLSHVSAHKIEVAQLKTALAVLGVSSFVAHEDIEPTSEWQGEIIKAIWSMHAMAALLTPEFHQSNWTDHEVGMALGRRTLVIRVSMGLTPYGFMSTNQAMRGTFADPSALAVEIAQILAKNQATRNVMADAAVAALETSVSFNATFAVMKLIDVIPAFTNDQLQRMEAATRDNSQVTNAFNVTGRIAALMEWHRQG